MRVLILGGYGNFGARIARALAGDPRLTLLIGGRDGVRAQALAQGLAGQGATTGALTLDHTQPDFGAQLAHARVDLMLHTAGPFQGQDYRVAEAALQAGAHYVDLADGRRFVCDFVAALDTRARAAGRVAITGASTLPALSSAVVDHLCAGWTAIDTIDICIAPAQTAPRGEATISAVLGSCGAPIRVWEQGRWQTRRGWAQPQPVRIAGLRDRLGALCDVPDLELFPQVFGARERVMFRAALEVPLMQQALALLASVHAAGFGPTPARWAGVLQRTAPWFDRLGSATGGMVVRTRGRDANGLARRRSWHIVAGDDHGPEIPTLAAILLARRLARDQGPASGAHACVRMLALAEFAPEFARWAMTTDVVDEADGDAD